MASLLEVYKGESFGWRIWISCHVEILIFDSLPQSIRKSTLRSEDWRFCFSEFLWLVGLPKFSFCWWYFICCFFCIYCSYWSWLQFYLESRFDVYVFVGIVSTISLFTKCDGVQLSCFVRFLVPLSVSSVFINVEYKLLLIVLSLNIVL